MGALIVMISPSVLISSIICLRSYLRFLGIVHLGLGTRPCLIDCLTNFLYVAVFADISYGAEHKALAYTLGFGN